MPILFSSFPGWQKIADVSASVLNFTDLDVTDLHLTAANNYMIIVTLNAAGGSTPNVSLFVNDVTDAGEYASSVTKPVAGVQTLTGANNAVIIPLPDAVYTTFFGILTFRADGYPVVIGSAFVNTGTAGESWFFTWHTCGEIENYTITKLTLHSDAADGLAMPARIQIFKTV